MSTRIKWIIGLAAASLAVSYLMVRRMRVRRRKAAEEAGASTPTK